MSQLEKIRFGIAKMLITVLYYVLVYSVLLLADGTVRSIDVSKSLTNASYKSIVLILIATWPYNNITSIKANKLKKQIGVV